MEAPQNFLAAGCAQGARRVNRKRRVDHGHSAGENKRRLEQDSVPHFVQILVSMLNDENYCHVIAWEQGIQTTKSV
jgi:hypothetical protein